MFLVKDDFFVVLQKKIEILRFDLLITADTLVAYVKVLSDRKLNFRIDKGIVLYKSIYFNSLFILHEGTIGHHL